MENGTRIAITAVFFPAFILVGLVVTLISDIGIYVLLGGLFLFFLILGIALITGHGMGMIAGVNTMTESEKKEYDLEKIGKSVGLFMIVASTLPLTIVAFDATMFAVYTAILLLAIVWLVWYVNVRCRNTSRRKRLL